MHSKVILDVRISYNSNYEAMRRKRKRAQKLAQADGGEIGTFALFVCLL